MRRLHFSRRAARDVERIDQWWIQNRPAAPNLFYDEVRDATELLRQRPNLGQLYRPRSGVRRYLLRASRYHVYYEAHADRIEVLTIWSALRGRAPKL